MRKINMAFNDQLVKEAQGEINNVMVSGKKMIINLLVLNTISWESYTNLFFVVK